MCKNQDFCEDYDDLKKKVIVLMDTSFFLLLYGVFKKRSSDGQQQVLCRCHMYLQIFVLRMVPRIAVIFGFWENKNLQSKNVVMPKICVKMLEKLLLFLHFLALMGTLILVCWCAISCCLLPEFRVSFV